MPKLPEFLQQIMNKAWDEKSLPSGQCIDKAEQTLLCPFLFPSALITDTPQSAQKKKEKEKPLQMPIKPRNVKTKEK